MELPELDDCYSLQCLPLGLQEVSNGENKEEMEPLVVDSWELAAPNPSPQLSDQLLNEEACQTSVLDQKNAEHQNEYFVQDPLLLDHGMQDTRIVLSGSEESTARPVAKTMAAVEVEVSHESFPDFHWSASVADIPSFARCTVADTPFHQEYSPDSHHHQAR